MHKLLLNRSKDPNFYTWHELDPQCDLHQCRGNFKVKPPQPWLSDPRDQHSGSHFCKLGNCLWSKSQDLVYESEVLNVANSIFYFQIMESFPEGSLECFGFFFFLDDTFFSFFSTCLPELVTTCQLVNVRICVLPFPSERSIYLITKFLSKSSERKNIRR